MRAYRDQQGWLQWVVQHERRFDEMKQAELNIREFWPSQVVEGNFDHARELVADLGLEFNERMVKAFIDPTLYRRGK